ncbi:MAG: hypothetical protein HYS51_00095 [Candidatus Zambryskibacteria bacterium]|nr:hypothetical protein [Candidatus Zambryskibacteria bacterium]
MNPEERALLEQTLKLSEENNRMLRNIRKTQRRAAIYGFIKLVIIIVPLVAGYLFLQPYLNQALEGYNGVQRLLKSY